MNKDIVLKKTSNTNFQIYIADVSFLEELDFIHFKLSKQDHVADVKSIDGIIQVTRFNY